MATASNEAREVVNAGGKNMTFMGVLMIILGILALLAPGMTGLSITIMLGILACFAGGIRIIRAFKAGCLGKGVLVYVVGNLTLFCGIILARIRSSLTASSPSCSLPTSSSTAMPRRSADSRVSRMKDLKS